MKQVVVVTETEKALRLEEAARDLSANIAVNAMGLAEIIVELYPLRPWHITTEGRKATTITVYFRDVVGIHHETGIRLPYEARRFVVESVFDSDSEPGHVGHLIDDISAMTGWGERTIRRDRAELGYTNPVRSNAQQESQREVARERAREKAEKKEPLPASVGKYINRHLGNNVVLEQVATQAVDAVSDVLTLTRVIAHATARLAEISRQQ